jgi:hypothetical protein
VGALGAAAAATAGRVAGIILALFGAAVLGSATG